QLLLLVCIQAAGNPVLGVIGQVLGLVVVKGVRRAQTYRRQYLATQRGDGVFRALNPLLDQNLRVVGTGGLPGLNQRSGIVDLGHADAGTLVGRLDDQRKAQALCCSPAIGFTGQYRMAWRRQPEALPNLLGAQFVHGQGGSQDAAAGIGNSCTFEQSLHAAVLTTAPVQDDKGAVDALRAQTLQKVIAHIDAKGIDARRLQGRKHCRTGLQGDFTLRALATVEYGDPAKGLGVTGRLQGRHSLILTALVSANSGLLISCGASPPISPAPWHSRMSPARSSGLTSGASSTPRSM